MRERRDSRIVARRPGRGVVLIQSQRGEHCMAHLKDISTYGCNLLTDSQWLRTGNFIGINLGADRTIQAIVRWVRNGSVGVEFLRPIPDAEADRIAVLTN